MKDYAKSLAEQMAIAVLRGDMGAALALADKLVEERNKGINGLIEERRNLRETTSFLDGFTLYHTPEFQAFCNRIGLIWELRTTNIVIRIPVEGLVEIEQTYQGSNNQESNDESA